MNQIFRITVGQDTLQGRLPPIRVGKDYWCRFHIFGVGNAAGTSSPKIWIATGEDTYFWTGEWSSEIGCWVINISTAATATVASKTYALTAFGMDADQEFFIGQAPFVVFNTIASDGVDGGTAGVPSAASRLDAIEAWIDNFADLPMFDPESARDIEMREQVQTITNKLRGAIP